MITCKLFRGLNTFLDAGDLKNGDLQQADNVVIEGTSDGGTLVSRPGAVGHWTSALGNPVYEPFPYLKADGTTQIIFTSNGKIYRSSKTALSPTELLNGMASFAVSSANFRQSRLGNYDYMVDGVGKIIRTDLTADTAQFVSGLDAPTVAPTASLTDLPLDAMTSTSGWTCEHQSGAHPGNLETNGTFASGISTGTSYPAGGATAGGFTFIGPDVDFWTAPHRSLPSGYSGTWCLVDDPLEGFYNTTAYPNDPISTDSTRYGTQFYLRASYYTADTSGVTGFTATILAYSDTGGTTLIASQSISSQPAYAGQAAGQYWDAVVSFPGLSTAIKSLRVYWQGAATNKRGIEIYFSNIQFSLAQQTAPVTVGVGPTAGGLVVSQNTALTGSTDAYYGKIGGVRLTRDYGSNQNWSIYDTISFALASNSSVTIKQLVADGFSFCLAFWDGTSTYYYTDPVAFSDDFTYCYVDISTIGATVTGAFRYLQVVFLSDIATDTLISPLLTLGPLTASGNLSISSLSGGVQFSDYIYSFSELDDADNATYVPQLVNVVESSFSPDSASIQPTGQKATGQVVIPASINASTDWIAVYRYGGVFSDGYARLVATLPVGRNISAQYQYTDLVIDGTTNTKVSSVVRPFVAGDVGKQLTISSGTGFTVGFYKVASVAAGVATLSSAVGTLSSTGGHGAFGDYLNRDLNNPYVTWDYATRTLTDNTPDSFLFQASLLQQGRDKPPTGAQALAAWHNRLWPAKGSTLYGSWNVVLDAEAGLYFTDTDLTTDPEIAKKGVTFTIGAADNDPIQAIVPLGSYLVVFKQFSVWAVTGFSPADFAITQYITGSGIGLAAKRAYAIVGNQILFLASDGVYRFDGSATTASSIQLEKVLSLQDNQGNSLIDPAAYAKCSMVTWNRRVYLMAPTSGDSQNTVMYVLDTRIAAWSRWSLQVTPFDAEGGGWTRWITPTGFTSGASLTGSTDADEGYFGGYDGQLYSFVGALDKAIPSASGTGMLVTVKTKGFGQEGDGLSRFTKTRPTRAWFDVMGTASWKIVTTGDITSASATATYATSLPETSFRLKLSPSTSGMKPSITLSATATSQIKIRAIGLDASHGTVNK